MISFFEEIVIFFINYATSEFFVLSLGWLNKIKRNDDVIIKMKNKNLFFLDKSNKNFLKHKYFHILNTPKLVSGILLLSEALKLRPNTVRV